MNDYNPKCKPKQDKSWVTEDVKRLFNGRRQARRTPNYQKLDMNVKKTCNKAYTDFLNEKCDEIDYSKIVIPAEAHRRVKELSEKKRSSCHSGIVKNEKGIVVFEAEDVKKLAPIHQGPSR